MGRYYLWDSRKTASRVSFMLAVFAVFATVVLFEVGSSGRVRAGIRACTEDNGCAGLAKVLERGSSAASFDREAVARIYDEAKQRSELDLRLILDSSDDVCGDVDCLGQPSKVAAGAISAALEDLRFAKQDRMKTTEKVSSAIAILSLFVSAAGLYLNVRTRRNDQDKPKPTEKGILTSEEIAPV